MIKKRDPKQFIESADKEFVSLITSPGLSKIPGKHYTFYLDQAISERIDKLTLIPRTQRISRSDIIRAGIELLENLSEFEIDNFFKKET